jgi:phosphoribosylformylglycinamidine synthase subunit PurS
MPCSQRARISDDVGPEITSRIATLLNPHVASIARGATPLYAGAKCRDQHKRVEPVKAKIHVYLKPGVLDPQGAAVAGALHNMGYDEVTAARQGKLIELDLTGDDVEAARKRVDEMCAKLLSNPVIESYSIELA